VKNPFPTIVTDLVDAASVGRILDLLALTVPMQLYV